MVTKVKVIGTGKNRRTVEEYRLDLGLLALMRQMSKLEEQGLLLATALGG